MTLYGKELGEAAWECWGQFGVPVFACDDAKQPLCKWKEAASCDRDVIVSMFERLGPRARMIGGVMGPRSGLFAIDFDYYKGPEAREFLDILMASGMLPPTRVHETKSAGLHYIYGVKEGQKYPRNSLPHKNVEIRGDGGYIILPPSHGYKVQSEGVIDAPDGLLKRLARAEAQFSSLSISGLTEMVMSGASFHEALTSLAAKLHARGDDPAKVMKTLQEAMEGSVAANPRHERHERWLRIMRGSDGELARLNTSAFKKFNPKRHQMDVDNVAPKVDAARRNRDVTVGGFFAGAPDSMGGGDGGTFAAPVIQQKAAQTAPQISSDEFPFERSYNAADVEEQDNKNFLIYPLIMEGDVIVLSAEPKAGKTLTAMTLCLHAAAGVPFGGDLTPMNAKGEADKISIIYFALEGQGAIRKRVRAWLRHHHAQTGQQLKPEDLRLFVVERPVNLTSDEAKQELVDKMVLAQVYFQKKGWGPIGMTVFDTLTKAMPGKDQNSVEDTSAVFQTVDMMREVNINCAVMFIHHNNRQSKSPRGSSNILAEPDTILSVAKVDPVVVDGVTRDCVQMSVYMARAIDDAQVYTMAMQNVEIGLNTQKIMEVAPVLDMLENYAAQPKQTDAALRKNLGRVKAQFYKCVTEALADKLGMELTFSQLAKVIQKNDKVATYYNSFLNDNTAAGAKATWEVLTSKEQMPDDMQGMTLEVTEFGVKLALDTSALMSGTM